MKIIHDEINLDTNKEVELINITDNINSIIIKNDIIDGIINISTKHTTSSIIINEDETGLKKDIINFYENIIPFDDYYHDKIDNNARSHLKSLLSTPTQSLQIKNRKLNLGYWQSIFFVELDGPRHNRTINITIIGE